MALADGAAAREEIAEHVATIRAASAYNEAATVKAMQQLFSMCRSKTPGHLANQAAAAEAGGVAALLELVGQGSTRSRTWAFNTLGRLCFDHADNAAQVCESGAIEAAVANVLGCAHDEYGGAVDVGLALRSHDDARVKDKSAYLLGNLAARPASHRRLLQCGAASAAVAVLRALNLAHEQGLPEGEIHAAFIARSVGLLTNLSVHEPSRAAVREAGALEELQRVARESGHDSHRPASAAIASANLCSDSSSDPASIPQLEPMPEKVLEYVVKALSSAVKREKYMGNVYYTPWKVAMGVQNLAAMHALNLQRLAAARVIEPLVDGLSFDERSAEHCSRALYELCAGNATLEHELLPRPQRALTTQLRVLRTLTPLVVAMQRVAWARAHHDGPRRGVPPPAIADAGGSSPQAVVAVGKAVECLSGDVLEMVGCRVAQIWSDGRGWLGTVRLLFTSFCPHPKCQRKSPKPKRAPRNRRRKFQNRSNKTALRTGAGFRGDGGCGRGSVRLPRPGGAEPPLGPAQAARPCARAGHRGQTEGL